MVLVLVLGRGDRDGGGRTRTRDTSTLRSDTAASDAVDAPEPAAGVGSATGSVRGELAVHMDENNSVTPVTMGILRDQHLLADELLAPGVFEAEYARAAKGRYVARFSATAYRTLDLGLPDPVVDLGLVSLVAGHAYGGWVRSPEGQPIVAVTVILYDRDEEIGHSAPTDDSGAFAIPVGIDPALDYTGKNLWQRYQLVVRGPEVEAGPMPTEDAGWSMRHEVMIVPHRRRGLRIADSHGAGVAALVRIVDISHALSEQIFADRTDPQGIVRPPRPPDVFRAVAEIRLDAGPVYWATLRGEDLKSGDHEVVVGPDASVPIEVKIQWAETVRPAGHVRVELRGKFGAAFGAPPWYLAGTTGVDGRATWQLCVAPGLRQDVCLRSWRCETEGPLGPPVVEDHDYERETRMDGPILISLGPFTAQRPEVWARVRQGTADLAPMRGQARLLLERDGAIVRRDQVLWDGGRVDLPNGSSAWRMWLNTGILESSGPEFDTAAIVLRPKGGVYSVARVSRTDLVEASRQKRVLDLRLETTRGATFRVLSSSGVGVNRPILSLAGEDAEWLEMRMRGGVDGTVHLSGLIDGQAYAVAAFDPASGDVAVVRGWKPKEAETVLAVEPTATIECRIECPDGGRPATVWILCEPVVRGLCPPKHASLDAEGSIRVPGVAGALYDVTIRTVDEAGHVYMTKLPASKLIGQRTFRVAPGDMQSRPGASR
jgi:hypothetical protein